LINSKDLDPGGQFVTDPPDPDPQTAKNNVVHVLCRKCDMAHMGIEKKEPPRKNIRKNMKGGISYLSVGAGWRLPPLC
jgi:hypothetical protein